MANLTSAVGRLAITVVLARRLGPEGFGLFVFVQWLIEMTFLVYSVGLTGVATRFFPQSTDPGAGEISGLNRWFLQAGVLAVLLTGCFATLAAALLSGIERAGAMGAVTLWAAAYSIWALLSARAQGLFQFKRLAAASGVFVVVALLGLSMPQVGGDLVGAMMALAAANLAACTFCVTRFTGGEFPRTGPVDLTRWRAVRMYATNAWLTSIANSLVWSRGEISVVKGTLGETAVGYYSVGLTLAGIVNQGISLFTGALWPRVARAWDRGERDELVRFSGAVTQLLILVASISAGFVICFAPYIVGLLFGDRYSESSKLVLILAIGVVGLSSGCAHLVVQAATNGKFSRDLTIAGGVALFGSAFVLVPLLGVEGAAVVRTAIQIGVSFLTLVWLGKVLGHNSVTRQSVRSFVLVVALAVGLAALQGAGLEIRLWSASAMFAAYSGLVYAICSRGWERGLLRRIAGS